ncbi:divergent PAP2 family protein [Synechococcus sp. Nb3U1]|uniref:divergent PAP2 family protein n=1 Tax=Synechococcus sp. Nb3U1 TaxID=1914529 RepID=UPI001F2BAAC2|nr:divergent PAP2 family protein [Synechococcus sp. Nb3U1]MCF2972439.1 divergent PAP2 family protein [Synechococcus sp. Nb3U1]
MLQQLMANHVLWTALIASLLAQAMKLILTYAQSGKVNLRVLVETGGMPSSHAALVTALAIGVGLQEGWDSLLFAATVVFALVVMYDAAGIRQAAGKQARVLNRLMEEWFEEKGAGSFKEPYLKELLGHTPVQVIAGAALGAACIGLSFALGVN